MNIRLAEGVVLVGSGLIIILAGMVGTVVYLKPLPVRFVYNETEQSKVGDLIYRHQYCGSCHEIFANGSTYGPNLDGIGSRRTLSWLREYIQSPRSGVSIKPYRLKMPAFKNLQKNELDNLVIYLSNLRELDANQKIIQPPSYEPL